MKLSHKKLRLLIMFKVEVMNTNRQYFKHMFKVEVTNTNRQYFKHYKFIKPWQIVQLEGFHTFVSLLKALLQVYSFFY